MDIRARWILLLMALAVIRPVAAESTSTYVYDTLGRLSRVTHWNGTVVAYSYDATGNRTGMTVTDGAKPTVTAGDLTFGTVTLGSTAPTRTLTVRNDGKAAMTLTGLSGLTLPFSVKANTCTAIAAGATCTIAVQLATGTTGTWSQIATTVGATVNISVTASATVS